MIVQWSSSLASFFHVALGLLTLLVLHGIQAASFYGASYVTVAFQEAKSTTEVHLRFKTHQSDALLLLAAGRTDYCLIVLESGGLKVRINLGAGEAELTSPPGLKLNDLMWHEASLQRTDANMQLVVDTIHRTRLSIPGRFYELNIHFGVYVGGLGDFNELFLGNMESFRGCLDNLTFNSINIFRQSRDNAEQRGVQSVTWDCSAEFDATSERAYSFVGPGAFLALPTMSARNGGTFSFDMKSQGNTSVLLYNGGLPSRSDFVALEMLVGKPKLSVDKGNGVVELKSDVVVNDGLWHHIEVRFSPTYVEINVDDHVSNLRPSLGENKHFDLVGKLYLGGIELNKQARALAHGLESMLKSDTHDGSFKGCMHNFNVNNQLLGLREAEVTKEMQVDCVWEYPCLRDPCIEGAACHQQGTDSFRCVCDQPMCVKTGITTGYKLYSKSTQPDELEILELQPVQVKEGGNKLLTSNNIDVVLDYHKYGIRESAVLFHVVHLPEHGRLDVEIWRRPGDSIFTLLDLNSDKVRYVHDGSENHQDTLVLEVEFIVRRDRVPEYLAQRHRFVVSIVVSPVNDPPELKLPPGRVLRLAQNTKKLLTNDILNASDEDNEAEDLVYTVLTLGSENSGYIESSNSPGVPVETFTQSDVNHGLVSYVHKGPANTRIAFRVSDGIETGQTAVLRIAAFNLELHMANNTGLVVTYNSFAYILPENLTFATNAVEQDLDIRFDITRPPLFGSVQRLRNNGHWQTVNHFTQHQMTKDKLRYVHTTGRPSHDEFKFTVTCNDLTISTVYDFRITFQAVTLHVVQNNELLLDQVQEKTVGVENLKVETSPITTPEAEILYSLVTVPVYGSLYVAPKGQATRAHLEVNSNFSQADVDQGHVNYRLNRKSYSAIFDNFLFRVVTPNEASEVLQFSIRHLPGETDAIIIVERIEVEEGGSEAITSDRLHVETPVIKEFVFNVTRLPHYGWLQIAVADQSGEKMSNEKKNVTLFTTTDIKNGLVSYAHDDSEHDRDSFVFLVVPRNDQDFHDFQYIGTQHVHVRMKNDNPPDRAVDKVFQVVVKGERLLTGDDLRYIDPDIDTPPYIIQYTRRGIPNGALFHLSNLDAQVFQFTQKDLDDRNILFRHTGPTYGRTVFWVTDGQFYTTGILEIRASEPFINVVNNTGIVVKRGKKNKISRQNLNVETNINVHGKDIKYTVTTPPARGKVLLKGQPTFEFTQVHIDDEMVEYENDNSNHFQDSFLATAQIGTVKTDTRLGIKIFPESYWEPLNVTSNKTVTVDEGQVVLIDQSALQVTHPNVDPRDITFVVHSHPLYGTLEVDNNVYFSPDGGVESTAGGGVGGGVGGGNHFAGGTVTIFDQATINEGKLKYVQTHQNVSEDSFTFDVTNGVVQIPGLIFRLHIISKVILLQTKQLAVEEGGRTVVTTDHVVMLSRYAPQHSVMYEVVAPPSNGHVENLQKPGVIISHFSSKMLADGVVRYVHDGSETIKDTFSIVARIKESDRESLPTPVHVLVNPVNDEFPKLVNNTGLQVWDGSATVITTDYLAAIDEDSQAGELQFLLTSPKNGYIAFRNNSQVAINNFTQLDLKRGNVIYVHTGSVDGSSGGFYFQVTDGVNIGSRESFVIKANPITLELVNNERLYVFPKVRQTISSENLLVMTTDKNPTREIGFTITAPPKLGKILLENVGESSVRETSKFTQRDINGSLLIYEHTKPFTDLTASDSFRFNIECLFAPTLLHQEFHVEISLLKINPQGLDQYIELQAAVVQEGERIAISQENLNTSGLAKVLSETDHLKFVPKIHMILQEVPEHGVLELRGENITVGASFTQTDINEMKLEYVHDHSDTLVDEMTFSIYLDSSAFGGTDANLLNSSLNFTILPVNDQNFELITKTPRIEVVQGQTVQITPDNLKTVDPDNFPQDLRYDIVTAPSTGRVVLKDDMLKSVRSFTQEDIDDGKLFYVHEGSDDTATFYFKVSDGEFRAVYKVFNIYVVPLSLKMANNSAITISQATTAVYLKSENLGADTNGNRSRVTYNVTLHPKHGMLLLHDESISQFHQTDVDKEQVIYMLVEKGVSEDSFTTTVWMEELALENQVFKMVVTPLIDQRDYHMPLGSRVVLTLAFLNATLLAQQSRSNPVFTLTRPPQFGVLRLLKRRGRPKRDEQASNAIVHFTHGDVAKRRVYYEFVHRSDDLTNDSFEYRLSALDVPPAYGRFDFIFHPAGTVLPDMVTVEDVIREDSAIEERVGRKKIGGTTTTTASVDGQTATPSSGNTLTEDTTVYSPHISNDHLIIIGVAVGVILLGIIIVATVKCHRHRRKQCKNKKSTATKNGGPLASHHHGGRPECDQRPDILEQQSHASDYLNDEVPSISSRSGPTSPKLRPTLSHSLRHEITPLRVTPSPSHDDEWLEISSTVPSCKVTPLGLGLETNETTLKYPYGMLEPHDVDEWGMYDHAELRFQRANNPMLKKNQYWV